MADPGEGAIEYARTLTAGLTLDAAGTVIRSILAEPPDDPRVKRCICCGYPFRDVTRPGNAKVCGPSCKTPTKTAQKRVQRARTHGRVKIPIVYVFWLEYPYWISERVMLSRVGSYERPFDPDKITQIAAARQRKAEIGGRKKPNYNVDY